MVIGGVDKVGKGSRQNRVIMSCPMKHTFEMSVHVASVLCDVSKLGTKSSTPKICTPSWDNISEPSARPGRAGLGIATIIAISINNGYDDSY